MQVGPVSLSEPLKAENSLRLEAEEKCRSQRFEAQGTFDHLCQFEEVGDNTKVAQRDSRPAACKERGTPVPQCQKLSSANNPNELEGGFAFRASRKEHDFADALISAV